MRKGIGGCKVIVIVAVEFLFKKSEKEGSGNGHNEIDHHYDACGMEEEIKCADCAFVHEEEIRKSDYGKDGSIFDIDDKVVADLGDYVAESLGNDYIYHGLNMVHADCFCAFGLARIDGKDTAADGFRHICTGIDGNNEKCGEIDIHFVIENHDNTVIDENGLDYHRGSAEKFDITFKNKVYDFKNDFFPCRVFAFDRNGLNNAYSETDKAAHCRADKRNDKGVERAFEKCGTISVPDFEDAFDKFCQGYSPFYILDSRSISLRVT